MDPTGKNQHFQEPKMEVSSPTCKLFYFSFFSENHHPQDLNHHHQDL